MWAVLKFFILPFECVHAIPRGPKDREQKISPKRKFSGRISRGHPGVIRADILAQNFGQVPQNPGKTSIWARTSITRRRGRPRPQGIFKNFGQKNFGLNFRSLKDQKNSRFQSRLKISIENEFFERATLRGPFFVWWGNRDIEIKIFERDQKIRSRFNFFDLSALWVGDKIMPIIQQFPRVTSIGPLPPKTLGKSRGPAQSPAETPQNPRRDPAEPSERPPQSPLRRKFPRRASRRVVPLGW